MIRHAGVSRTLGAASQYEIIKTASNILQNKKDETGFSGGLRFSSCSGAADIAACAATLDSAHTSDSSSNPEACQTAKKHDRDKSEWLGASPSLDKQLTFLISWNFSQKKIWPGLSGVILSRWTWNNLSQSQPHFPQCHGVPQHPLGLSSHRDNPVHRTVYFPNPHAASWN